MSVDRDKLKVFTVTPMGDLGMSISPRGLKWKDLLAVAAHNIGQLAIAGLDIADSIREHIDYERNRRS